MSEDNFTPDERARLSWLLENENKIKQLVDKDEKVSWALATIRNIAVYLTAIMAGWLALKEFFFRGGQP